MPKFRIHLANGRSLVLEGDEQPTDADIEQAATEAGVRGLLMAAEGEAPAKEPSIPPSGAIAPSAALIGEGVRRGVERLALEAATSPRTAKVPAMIGYGGTAVAVANDLRRGEYGRAASDAVMGGGGTALTQIAAGKGAESGIRSGAGLIARLAPSPLVRGVMSVATLPFTEAGDRPVNETPETTGQRQMDFAQMYKERVNREAGREVITGNTTREILASIRKHRESK